MKEYLTHLPIALMLVLVHTFNHVKHKELSNKIDNYIVQERNARIILSDNINSRIDMLEQNIKSILDENLTIFREEIELNMDVVALINEMTKEDCNEIE